MNSASQLVNEASGEGFFDSPYSPEEITRLAKSRDPFERWEAANALQFIAPPLSEDLRLLLAEDADELVRGAVAPRGSKASSDSRGRGVLATDAREKTQIDPSGVDGGNPREKNFLDDWAVPYAGFSEEAERDLFARFRKGSETEKLDSIENLIRHHYGLVKECAVRMLPFGGELDDLIQVGINAVITAIRTFDEKRGYRFAAYLLRAVRSHQMRAIDDSMRTVRVPTGAVEKFTRYQKLYEEKFGVDAPIAINEELCAAVKSKPQTLRLVNAVINGVSSIDDMQIRTSLRHLPDETDYFLFVEDAQLSEVLDSVLWSLTEREDGVIRMRYGIGDDIPRTLDEIGEVFGVTRERIRQVEAAAIVNLRQEHRLSLLRPFVGLDETDILFKMTKAENSKEKSKWVKPSIAYAYAGLNVTIRFTVGSLGRKNGHTYINAANGELFYLYIEASPDKKSYEALEILLLNKTIQVSGLINERSLGKHSIEIDDPNQISFLAASAKSTRTLRQLLSFGKL